MDVETSRGKKFRIEIRSTEEIAVAVHLDGEERIFLPEKEESSGTYYHETSDALVETQQGYSLKLDSEPESFEIIS